MASSPLHVILPLVVGLGLLNVRMVRRRGPTGYRGGDALTLRGECVAYGLPDRLLSVVGGLKVVAVLAIGLWIASRFS